MDFLKAVFIGAIENPLEVLVRFGVSAALFLAATVVVKVYDKTMQRGLLHLANKSKTQVWAVMVEAFHKPIKSFIIGLGLYFALIHIATSPFLPTATGGFVAFLSKAMRIFVIISIVWGLANSTETATLMFKGFQNKLDFSMDKTITNFVSKLCKAIIIAFGAVIIIAELGYDINGLIAGIGLGGLTFALAAQDTASNFFGGLVILMDKPFAVDDWISTADVEGIVEDISFRSTRIRTFTRALIVVPNSTLASTPITNWSQMNKRRILFTLNLSYFTTKEQLEAIVTQIKALLENHEGVHQESIVVTFNEFADSSLDVYVMFFSVSTVFAEHMILKEEINFKVMEIVHGQDAHFAFPSTSIYFENKIPS